MTTIAYRDGVLAADSLATSNGLRDDYGSKIWKIGRVLVGACGDRAICLKFREWVANGLEGDSPFQGKEDGNGIVVAPGGNVVCWGNHGPWPVSTPFYSLGSGYQIAIGALEMGATASEAVEIAARHDTSTGGRVAELRA
jgi:hypothetical protein